MSEPQYHLSGVVHARSEALEDFDGPLDVILLLLSKNKIEIQDVSISTILEQYLAYLDEQKRLDMEIASEFIGMASYLMLIKTKMLLSYAEQQEAMSEMEQLIQSLTERQQQEAMRQLRTALPFMEAHNGSGSAALTKEPEPVSFDKTYRYQHDRSDLLKAVAWLSERRERALPPPVSNFTGVVGREQYPVARKAAELVKRLLIYGRSKLRRLFEACQSKSEIVATFLAVLELCKVNSLALDDAPDGEETISFLKMPAELEENG